MALEPSALLSRRGFTLVACAVLAGCASAPAGTLVRNGVEGEPVPIDSPDPKYHPYLELVRRMIKDKWIYPCVPNIATRQCEYKAAQLELEFGIAKDGRVPFVVVRQPSQYGIYDEHAVNAIRQAAPFPPVPDEISKKGIPILARFNYVLAAPATK